MIENKNIIVENDNIKSSKNQVLEKKKLNKKLIAFITLFIILMAFIIIFINIIAPKMAYNTVKSELKAGNYKHAMDIMEKQFISNKRDDYKDIKSLYSSTQEKNDNYKKALNLIACEQYEKASKLLEQLPENYCDRKILLDNIDRIKILVDNVWVGVDGISTFTNTFTIRVKNDNKLELRLHTSEDMDSEYWEHDEDMDEEDYYIDLADLLNNNSITIESTDFGDKHIFKIDNILNGSYEKYFPAAKGSILFYKK